MEKATQGRTYIWELPGWPRFTWSDSDLAKGLDAARRAQSELLGAVKAIRGEAASEAAMEAMASEVVSNSAIEGVTLDMESVRASMMLRLSPEAEFAGVLELRRTQPVPPIVGQMRKTVHVDPIVGVLTEAVHGWEAPLSLERISVWHRGIFPKGVPDGPRTLPAGEMRGEGPMVVSTLRLGEEIIHFEAPGRDGLEEQIDAFLGWFNTPPSDLNGLLRAGMAHLWFITIHPMLDGNGRLARTLTDLALSQDERLPRRYYSLSVQIMRNKDAYYDALEAAQRGSLDITEWLSWFLSQVEAAARHGLREVGLVLARSAFWAEANRHHLNDRQEKVLWNVLSPGRGDLAVSNRRFRSITKISRATATRDLAELAEMRLMVPFGEARSASFLVDLDRFMPEGFRAV